MIPTLDKVLEEGAWNVEVYMWHHALSSKLLNYTRKYDRVVVHHLDDYLGNITFTNMKFQISNQEVWKAVCEHGVMFSIKPSAFPNQIPTD